MPKRKRPKVDRLSQHPDSTTPLRKAMSGRTKVELVDVLLELAKADRGILRQLTAQFDVAAAPDELVATTRQAIIDATAFDIREMNRNFNYDYAAYDEVKRNLTRLVTAKDFQPAMELSLELMKRGSYQVEMSDEGLMSDDIKECLEVVLTSLRKCDLPAKQLVEWCSAMLKSDRVDFIATDEIQSLRQHFQESAARPDRRA